MASSSFLFLQLDNQKAKPKARGSAMCDDVVALWCFTAKDGVDPELAIGHLNVRVVRSP